MNDFDFICEPVFDNHCDIIGYELLTRSKNNIPFYDLSSSKRLRILEEQINLIYRHRAFLCSLEIFFSLNIDFHQLEFLSKSKFFKSKLERLKFFKIEIKEDFLSQSENYIKLISGFPELSFWLDDFSIDNDDVSGIPDLRMFEMVKIDKDFLWGNIGSDRLKNIINYFNSNSISSICEGVDSMEKFNSLTSMGVRLFQGYLMGPVRFYDLILCKEY